MTVTLEQLMQALKIVSELTKEEFKERAPYLYGFFETRLTHQTRQNAARAHGQLLLHYLNNKVLQDEVAALVA